MKYCPPVFAFLTLFCGTLGAQTFDFDAVADATIYSNVADNNGGGHGFSIAGRANNGNERRTLLLFDLSSIAPGTSVQSASLDLAVNRIGSVGGGTFELFELDTRWNEGVGTGNQGAAALAGEVTWNEAQSGVVDWTDGGSFSPTLLSQNTISSVGTTSFESTLDFTSAVQRMIDNPATNFGFILRSTDPSSAVRLDTRDSGTPARLSVNVSVVPEPMAGVLIGFALLGGVLRRRR